MTYGRFQRPHVGDMPPTVLTARYGADGTLETFNRLKRFGVI